MEATGVKADYETLDLLLAEAVRLAVGSDTAQPRPGQRKLAHDMLRSALSISAGADEGAVRDTVAAAPTGVGKSISSLTVAVLIALARGERTILSTESLSLQDQYVTKDSPVVLQAARNLFGRAPKVALLKGWGNYACARAAHETARALTRDRALSVAAAGPALERVARAAADADEMWIDGAKLPVAATARLASWALQQTGAQRSGMKGDYPDRLGREWSAVTIPKAECIGLRCPFSANCRPIAARQAAGAAAVVVTNHTLIALQAAMGAPIVNGSKAIGEFDHIIVDEAHALPGEVRSRGQVEVSGRTILSVASALADIAKDMTAEAAHAQSQSASPSPRAQTLGARAAAYASAAQDGREIADAADRRLAALVESVEGKDVDEIGARVLEAVNDITSSLLQWMPATINTLFADFGAEDHCEDAFGRRAYSRLKTLRTAIVTLSHPETPIARWAETSGRHARAVGAPVDVGGMLRANLWSGQRAEAREADDQGAGPDPDGEGSTVTRKEYRLSVSAISATLPPSFLSESGLWAPGAAVKEYESPLDGAYGRSALFLPAATSKADIAALSRPGWAKASFDVAAHREWAAQHAVELCIANNGSALVLAATVANGKFYAEQLRQASQGRWAVHSQWDGASSTMAAAETWKADRTAVLVGTKSYFTGLDAKGDTCSLVVIDRPPRSAANAIDDARVDAIVDRAVAAGKRADDVQWGARSQIYAGDAALLLEQAAGRLIRAESDWGMVAVLDPRVSNKAHSAFVYAGADGAIYRHALRRFPRTIRTRADAADFLRASSAARQPAFAA